jgi:hypothetical protein
MPIIFVSGDLYGDCTIWGSENEKFLLMGIKEKVPRREVWRRGKILSSSLNILIKITFTYIFKYFILLYYIYLYFLIVCVYILFICDVYNYHKTHNNFIIFCVLWLNFNSFFTSLIKNNWNLIFILMLMDLYENYRYLWR